MATLTRAILGILVLLVVSRRDALAGMPSVTPADISREIRGMQSGLSDLAYQRLEVVSFFLLGLLGCAWVIQRVWNGLRRDFPRLPRLSFARALGFIVLWGLLFVVVLTMISGARELMTPGAWIKEGLTYKLARPSAPPPIEDEIRARVEAITRLGRRLVSIAESRERVVPPDAESLIEAPLWQLPSPPGGRYHYVAGRLHREGSFEGGTPLVYEPDSVGPDRLVFTNDQVLMWLPAVEIDRLLSEKTP
jgi:hypothetical protein